MVTESGFGNHLEKSFFCFFIKLSCVLSFSSKEDDTSSESSSSSSGTIVNTPKKIMKKIGKKILPYKCMKLKKKKDESPPSSKKIIGKVMNPNHNYMCLKIRQNYDKDEGCLWKKTILMGEKCQPLEFSGAIFYDSDGNQISEPPRSCASECSSPKFEMM